MKMTKKLFLVAIATAAFALTSCAELLGGGAFKGKNENGVDNGKQTTVGVKKNLTIHVEAKNDTEFGSKRFQRMWKQLGDKETVQALETVITIDTSNTESKLKISNDKTDYKDPDALFVVADDGTIETSAVTGLIFDMHCTKDSADKKLKTYDFVLIGYRPKDNGFYIEKYTGVTADLFEAATNATSFKTADEFITATQNAAYVYADNNDWVKSYNGKLGKDDDDKDYGDKAVSLKQFKVTITQKEKGKYKINVAGQDFEYAPADESADHPDWYTKDNKLTKNVDEGGYRIGGAGYYVNAPLGTIINANFNSKNDVTVGLEEEVAE
jgi:hypothetical protein